MSVAAVIGLRTNEVLEISLHFCLRKKLTTPHVASEEGRKMSAWVKHFRSRVEC